MSYLRFSRQEYDALCLLCRLFDLDAYPPHKLRRLLVGSLAATLPQLAVRVAGLRPEQLLLLREHFRRRTPPPEAGHGLTPAEVRAVAEACGPVLLQARLLGLFQRALVEFLREESPALAGKLGRLGRRQFEVLCGQVKGLLGRPR